MKKLAVFLVIIFLTYNAKSQILKGYILDSVTEKPISSVNIYFNGTFLGTSSNEKGYFELNVEGAKNKPIEISAIGYFSESISDYVCNNEMVVFLKPKTYNIEGVSISPDKMSRRMREYLFKTEFLGQSNNASKCIIENLHEIRLVSSLNGKVLKAFCDKPIKIFNRALGYHITYYLENFVRTNDSVGFQGKYFFSEDTLYAGNEIREVKRKRMNAYRGSRMHFIRALWKNNLDRERFRLVDLERNKLSYQNAIAELDSTTKAIKPSLVINVIYDNYEISKIRIWNNPTIIDSTGYYDSKGIIWSGKMSQQRIGDLLPFEFNPL